MSKVYERIITDFSGGISNDKRSRDFRKYGITKHFDPFTFQHKLVPHYKTLASLGVSGGDVKTLNIKKFLYAPSIASGYRLYGLGEVASSNLIKLYRFDIDGAADIDAASWVACANGASSVGTRYDSDDNEVPPPFYYKTFLFMLHGGTSLAKFDTTELAAWVDAYQSITYTNAVQPVHHLSDDCAYFFGDSSVYRLNNVTWNGDVLDLPTSERIVAACAYGDYLAIGTVKLGNLDKRITVYLWDRDSSLTTLSQRIDFGEGTLKYLANLEGQLIGVVDFYSNSALGLDARKYIVKRANGLFADVLTELTIDTVTPYQNRASTVKDGKLYFGAKATLSGDSRLGIWGVDKNGKLSLDTIEENATSFDGIYKVGNVWWIAHSADGSVSHTTSNSLYSTTNPSIYESLVLNSNADTTNEEKLIGVSVMTQKLSSGQQVVLKYRIDGGTSWTTIFTNTDTTVNPTSHDAINIESDGSNLPEYHELELRIESTGGAVITGLKYKASIEDKGKY